MIHNESEYIELCFHNLFRFQTLLFRRPAPDNSRLRRESVSIYDFCGEQIEPLRM